MILGQAGRIELKILDALINTVNYFSYKSPTG